MKHLKLLISTSLLLIGSVLYAELNVTRVERLELARELTFTGTIEAVNQGTASSQTSGRVTATLVDVGDLVAKDDVILRLRDTQQQANVQTAEAGVKAAQARYASAEKEYVRIQEIRSRELVSQSVADNALAARDAAKANLDAAEGRLKDALEQLEFTRIRAPYSGIVLERHVEVGETVNPGTPLYTGMSLERLRILAQVPQKDIDAIRGYQQARIQHQDGDIVIGSEDLTFFGYADPMTSTFKVRADLPPGTEGLYPGMYIAINFQVGVTNALVAPQDAIVNRGEVTAIYVKNDTGIQFRQIKTGRIYQTDSGTQIEVLSGLNEGESVVMNPSAAISHIKSQSANSQE